jgi:hypothetical protein
MAREQFACTLCGPSAEAALPKSVKAAAPQASPEGKQPAILLMIKRSI